MESLIVARLKGDSVLMNGVNNRLFAERVPQGKPYPALVYSSELTDSTRCDDGSSWDRYTVIVWAITETKADSILLSARVRTRLDGYSSAEVIFSRFERSESGFDDEIQKHFRTAEFNLLVKTVTPD